MYEKIIKQGKNARETGQGGQGLLEVMFEQGFEGGVQFLARRGTSRWRECLTNTEETGRAREGASIRPQRPL